MEQSVIDTLIGWAEEYNDPKYFQEDPIIFPTRFARSYEAGDASLADVEIAGLLAAHLAWGRRAMIVRDCGRMFDEMCWRPYDYVMNGEYRNEDVSLHRTIKWSQFAEICGRLRDIYSTRDSLEGLTDNQIRCMVFGQKEDKKAPNKKISMMDGARRRKGRPGSMEELRQGQAHTASRRSCIYTSHCAGTDNTQTERHRYSTGNH